MFMSFHLLWSLFDRDILWTMTIGGHRIRSSFKAKASGPGSGSGDQVPVSGSGILFHPIRTHKALWRPKCCGRNPFLWDMKAWVANALVFWNAFDALKADIWVRIARSSVENQMIYSWNSVATEEITNNIPLHNATKWLPPRRSSGGGGCKQPYQGNCFELKLDSKHQQQHTNNSTQSGIIHIRPSTPKPYKKSNKCHPHYRSNLVV